MKKINRKLYLAIALTTAPFLLFYLKMDFSLISEDFPLFLDQLVLYTANIVGYIGASLIIWQFILGIRHVSKFLSPDLVAVNKVHKVIGKYGVLLIALHPMLQKVVYIKPLYWILLPNFANEIEFHISLGRFAYALIWLIWITSVLVRGKLKYRPWKYLHFLTYPLLILVLFHIRDIGSFYNDYLFMQALWITVLLFTLLMLILRLLQGSSFLKKRYSVSEISHYGDEIFVIKLQNSENPIQPEIGQFIYVQMHKFGESHPFTIMDYENETGEIVLGIRDVGTFSSALKTLTNGDTLLLDGPFGVFTSEVNHELPVMILAGGIGITPFVKYVREHNEKTYLIYSNKKTEEVLEGETFMNLLDSRYIECITQEENEGTVKKRINRELIEELLSSEKNDDVQYMICGSPRFVNGMKDLLKEMGVKKEMILFEEFNF